MSHYIAALTAFYIGVLVNGVIMLSRYVPAMVRGLRTAPDEPGPRLVSGIVVKALGSLMFYGTIAWEVQCACIAALDSWPVHAAPFLFTTLTIVGTTIHICTGFPRASKQFWRDVLWWNLWIGVMILGVYLLLWRLMG